MELFILTKEEYRKNIPGLNALFKVAFNREIHPDYLNWRYLNNPVNDILVAVAVDNGKIIANYSVSPVLIKKDNDIFKTALSMTTMTHPDYNGRGLFTTLANLLYEEMQKRDYKFVWGFPNANSHGIFIKKLNWNDIYEIPNFRLNINDLGIVNMDSEFIIEEDNYFNNQPSFINYNGKYQVFKSKDYYKWRYLDNPENNYTHLILKMSDEVLGNIVYKEFNDSFDILELNGNNTEIKQQLVFALILRAKKQGILHINSWFNLYDDFHLNLEKIGFLHQSPITYLGIRKLHCENDVSSYSNWNIQMGDSDVY